jgi:hypothetical protein
MRRHAMRMLILVAALVALAIPVFNLTPSASACGNFTLNNCVTTLPAYAIGSTITSPLTFTVSSATFNEAYLAGETTYNVPGALSIGISDMRGNNEGFVVELSSMGGWAAGTNVFIPASDYTVTSSTATNDFCGISQTGGACETLVGYVPTSDLSSPQVIGCASSLIATGQEGYGLYTLDEGLLLSIPLSQQPLNEIFGTNPKSWVHGFDVTVLTGAAGGAVAPAGCSVD